MHLVSITWARNEEDILESFVRHNAAIVDRMIIVLHSCTDSSHSILQTLQTEGLPIEIRTNNAQYHAQGEVLTEVLRSTMHADWIMPLDADEYLCGDVRKAVETFDPNHAYAIPWKTYIPTPKDAAVDDPALRMTHRRAKESPQYTKVLIPRSLACSHTLPEGSHYITAEDGSVTHGTAQDALWIGHFPVRSELQLRRKIIQGWDHSQKNPKYVAGHGFHWANLYERCKDEKRISLEELQHIAVCYAALHDAPSEIVHDPLPLLQSVVQ